MAHLLDDLADAVVDGELKKIAALTQQALDSGTPAGDVLNQGLLPGMEVVGRRFKAGEISSRKCCCRQGRWRRRWKS